MASSSELGDDFDYIGIIDIGGIDDVLLQSAHRDRFVAMDGQDSGINGFGIDEWLVALYVDEEIAVLRGSDFRNAISAGGVVAAVMRTCPPKRRTAFAIRSSSVATSTSRM